MLLVRLDTGKPVDSVESKYRHIILEILNRLPNNELLRPYTPELLRVATETLARDNEDNALTCLRIIFDLHKNFRPSLEGEVQAFLDLVNRIYRTLPLSREKAFLPSFHAANSSCAPATSHCRTGMYRTHILGDTIHLGSAMSVGEAVKVLPLEGIESFKVLTECPLIVMLLFQLYPEYIQTNIPQLAPLMMGGLALRVPRSAYKLQRERYMEFIACQVKTLSFLTYLLRGFSDLMRPYESAIARSVITLMAACPCDATSIRKELLVATRHILATEFRRGFFEHINRLFDEDILIGKDRRCNDLLRPLALSTLADLVYHVLPKLTCAQLGAVVIMFSTNLQDTAIPLTVQTTSVRLLLNLVEFIFHNVSLGVCRSRLLILCMARALVTRCGALRTVLAGCIDLTTRNYSLLLPCFEGSHIERSSVVRLLHRYCLGIRHADNRPQSFFLITNKSHSNSSPQNSSDHGELRSLLLTLMRGLKTVMWCISHYRSKDAYQVDNLQQTAYNDLGRTVDSITAVQTTHSQSRKDLCQQVQLEVSPTTNSSPSPIPIEAKDSIDRIAFKEESQTIATFFAWGLDCCEAYALNAQADDTELKEILDSFAGAFTVLDARSLCASIGRNISTLFSAVQDTPQILGVAQLLLANTNSSELFAKLLLTHLVREIGVLSFIRLSGSLYDRFSCYDACMKLRHASVALQLFKVVLGSVALFDGNKEALHGFVREVVIRSLAFAALVHEPLGFFILLRALFRALDPLSTRTTRKLELSYSELEPIVPFILRALHALESRRAVPHIRVVVIELLLTLPARLMVLIEHLSEIWPAILRALQYTGDLSSVALRFFERCVDTFGVTYLFNQLSLHIGLLDALVAGVCRHVSPLPYSNGVVALRLLGKFGGFNRRVFPKPRRLWFTLQSHELNTSICASELSIAPLDTRELRNVQPAMKFKFSWIRSFRQSDGEFDSCFEFDITPALSDICSLFNTLSDVALTSFQGLAIHRIDRDVRHSNDARSGICANCDIPSAILSRFRILCFRVAVTSVGCMVRNQALGACGSADSSNHAHNRLERSDYCLRMEVMRSKLAPLFDLILRAAADDDTSVEALNVLRSMCKQICWVCKISKPLYSDSHSQNGAVIAFASPCQQYHENIRNVSYPCCGSLLRDMLIDTLIYKPPRLQHVALSLLKSSLDCYVLRFHQSPGALLKQPFLPDLIMRLCTVLSVSTRMPKTGIINALVQITTKLADNVAHVFETEILEAFLGMLNSTYTHASIQIKNMIVSSLCRMLRLSQPTQLSTSTGPFSTRTAHVLTRALCHLDACTRIAAQCALTELRLSQRSEQAALFCDISSRTVIDILTVCTQTWDNNSSIVSALDAVTYLMSLEPPVIRLDSSIMASLGRIVTVASFDDLLNATATRESMSFNSGFIHSRLEHRSCTRSSEMCFLFASGSEADSCAPRQLSDLLMSTFRAVIAGIRAGRNHSEGFASLFTCSAHHDFLSIALDAMCLGDIDLVRAADCLVKTLLTLPHTAVSLALLQERRRILLESVCSEASCGQMQSESVFFALQHLQAIPMLAKTNESVIISKLLSHLELLCAHAPTKKLMFVAPQILRLMALLPQTSQLHYSVHLKSESVLDEAGERSLAKQPREFLKRLTCVVLGIDLRCCKESDNATWICPLRIGPPKRNSEGCCGLCASGNVKSGRCTCALSGYHLLRPLADFISRHPEAATLHFFHHETLLESSQVDLLCSILMLSESSNLRSRLAHSEAINMLLVSAFEDNAPTSCGPSANHQHTRITSNVCDDGNFERAEAPRTEHREESLSAHVVNLSTVRAGRGTRSRAADRLSYEVAGGHKICSNFIRKFHCMRIVQTLLSMDPVVVVRNRCLIHAFRVLWREWSKMEQLEHVAGLWHSTDSGWCTYTLANIGMALFDPATQYHGIQLVAQCLLSYSMQIASDATVVYELLTALMFPSAIDLSDVELFLCETISCSWGTVDRESVFIYFLRIFVERRVSSEVKVLALRFVLTPIVVACYIIHRQKVKTSLLSLLMWCTLDIDPPWLSSSVELRVELLKLMTVLIEFHGEDIVEQRKEFIKFAWSHLKSEDSLARQWAYVNVCRFISTFETPPKIVLQVSVCETRRSLKYIIVQTKVLVSGLRCALANIPA